MTQLEPEDENKKIWRYMDFTKFVSLLDKSALFFTRADRLGDPFEGSHGKAYVNEMRAGFEEGKKDWAMNTLRKAYKKIVKFTFVSCWHLNDYDSEALWSRYLKSNEGIAVQSSASLLMHSIKDTTYDIHIGKIKYIDYEKEVMSGGLDEGEKYPFFHKQKSFEHEQELRLVIQEFKLAKGRSVMESKPPRREGIYISVDLNLLVERIYMAPTSPRWLFELVKSVTRKYGMNKEVLPSALDAKPMY